MLRAIKNTRNSKSNIITTPKQQENTVLFSYENYPFSNTYLQQQKTLKTVVHMDFSGQQLQQIISIGHANIISVKKIAKHSSKNKNTQQSSHKFYSFYYEMVQFGLKHLLENPKGNEKLFSHAIQSNISEVVRSVGSYLQQIGIYYPIKIDDFGITTDGELKVYVPTTAVLLTEKDRKYAANINAITNWWESCIAKIVNAQFKKQKAFPELMPPQLPIDQLEFSLNQSNLEEQFDNIFNSNHYMVNSYINLKGSLTSQSSAITKVGNYKMERLQLIDKEIRDMKQKLNEKTKRKGILEQSTKLARDNSKNMINSNIIQIKHSFNYNPSPQHIAKKAEPKEAKLSRQQPQQPKPHIIKRPNMVQSPQMNHQLYQFYDDQEDNLSLNTYQVQFQHLFPHPQKEKRNKIAVPVKRQLSEYSQQQKKLKKVEGGDKKHKNSINQVQVGNKKEFNSSVGPMFFNNMISKIKSQENIPKSNNNFTKMQKNQSQKRLQNEQDEQRAVFVPKHKKLLLQTIQHKLPIHSKGPNIEYKIKEALEKTKNAIQMFKKVKGPPKILKTTPQ